MNYIAKVRVVVHGAITYHIDADNAQRAREIALERARSGDWSMEDDLEIFDCVYMDNSDTRAVEDRSSNEIPSPAQPSLRLDGVTNA